MTVVERFLNYIKFDTQSSNESETSPSTLKQFDLAHFLMNELKELGVEDITLSDTCTIYGHIKANSSKDLPHIGFVSHMDTATDMTGKDVKANIIDYKGGDIILNEKLGIKMGPDMFESLERDKNQKLIVTDGTTLLGADDKAGVSEIMTLIAYVQEHPEFKHGAISFAFTPDEEVGRGTENFDPEQFKVDYAYTVDGGEYDTIEFENFNASEAKVYIKGRSIHPGSAKGKMLNSQLVGFEFNSLLPTFDNPAYTEGYEGFNHLCEFNGSCEETTMEYIIRNHDLTLLRKQENDFRNAEQFLNAKYGEGTVKVEFKDNYLNMRTMIEPHMEIIDRVKGAMKNLGVTAKCSPIRGGTDGAALTYKGILCPNLGTGGRNYHGKYEYAVISEMEFMVKLLIELVKE